MLAVREAASYHYAHGLGLDDVRLVPDTAFLTKAAEVDAARDIEPEPLADYFCVAGSSIIQFVELDALVTVVRRIRDESSLTPVLLLSSKQDEVLRRALAEALGGISAVRTSASHQEVAGVLAQARFLIGGRYHMSVLAAAVHTPFVSIPANTFKNEGLHELLHYPLPVRAPADLDGLLLDVQRVLRERDALSPPPRGGTRSRARHARSCAAALAVEVEPVGHDKRRGQTSRAD